MICHFFPPALEVSVL